MGRLAKAIALTATLSSPVWSQDTSAPFRVNSLTEGQQEEPRVAVAPDGRSIVVWTSTAADGTNSRIFVQQFGSDGSRYGSERLVSDVVTDGQMAPEVAADASANFVVVWHSFNQDGDGYGVFARRFAADGTPLGVEFQVNIFTEGRQSSPSVSSSPSGEFVVAWKDYARDGIYARRFDNGGVPQSDEILLTSSAFSDGGPSVSSDADGNFVVVWAALASSSFADIIRGQRFDSDGTPQGALLEIRPTVSFVIAPPIVTSSPTGAFAVAWTQSDINFVGLGTAWRSFDAGGTPLGVVYATTPAGETSRGKNHAAAWISNDTFAVVWEVVSSTGQTLLVGQPRNADGSEGGQVFTIATTADFITGHPSVGADASGKLFVVWSDGFDVFGRRLQPSSSLCPVLMTFDGEADRSRIQRTLYRLRDEWMARSVRGRRYIRRFYRHAPEAAWLLALHPELRDQTRRTLRQLHPTLEALAHGRGAWINSEEIAEVDGLMDAFEVYGSAGLGRTIRILRQELHDGTLEALFRGLVEKRRRRR